MGSGIPICCLIFGAVFILRNEKSDALVTGNILTNQVMEVPEEEIQDLPICHSGSACGYLQVNAFGVNQEQFCRCPSLSVICPLHWDQQDGHSLTMGSQQFKFCGPAPQLHICKRGERSYTYAVLYDQATYDVLGVMNNLHCFCPPPRTHIFHQSTDEVLDNMHKLGTEHTCNMLPICEYNAACKEISMSSATSLVTTTCQCQRGFVCPTLSSEAVSNEMNNFFSNGKAFSIHCQPWY